MATFEVTTWGARPSGPPRKRRSPAVRRLFATLRYLQGISVVGGLFGLTIFFLRTQLLFVLLPAGLSLGVTAVLARARLASLKALLLTTSVTLVFYSFVTSLELLTHGPATAEIVVITTTLAIAIVFEPLRALLQGVLERRLHVYDTTASQIVAAFTTALREQIALEQVRERFLAVVWRLLRPECMALWVRVPAQETKTAAPGQADRASPPAGVPSLPATERFVEAAAPATATTELLSVADDDPLLVAALYAPATLELEQLRLVSPALRRLRQQSTELVLPLTNQGELLGLLAVGPRQNSGERRSWGHKLLHLLGIVYLVDTQPAYGREDRDLLETLGVQVAAALRVVRLVRAQQAQVRAQERIEQELRTAQEIQRTFLPKSLPELPGWQLVPYYQPAREVGGDFYDVLPLADGRVGLLIGDVTGKGIPAALMMTATRTMLRTAAQEQASPAAVLARVNDLLCADIPAGMFVTCFYALLDPASGQLCFANAGHEAPFRRHAGCVSELWARGMPLGLMPGTQYDEEHSTIAPGESLLFYSDGLVEAHNPAREMLGFGRLRALLAAPPDVGASVAPHDDPLLGALLTALADFTGADWEQEDDVTLLALHRAAPPAEAGPA